MTLKARTFAVRPSLAAGVADAVPGEAFDNIKPATSELADATRGR